MFSHRRAKIIHEILRILDQQLLGTTRCRAHNRKLPGSGNIDPFAIVEGHEHVIRSAPCGIIGGLIARILIFDVMGEILFAFDIDRHVIVFVRILFTGIVIRICRIIGIRQTRLGTGCICGHLYGFAFPIGPELEGAIFCWIRWIGFHLPFECGHGEQEMIA